MTNKLYSPDDALIVRNMCAQRLFYCCFVKSNRESPLKVLSKTIDHVEYAYEQAVGCSHLSLA